VKVLYQAWQSHKKTDVHLGVQRPHEPLQMSYGPPLDHYLGGYQDRLLGGPLGLPDLCRTVPVDVRHKDYGGEVLG
jgi:hypothetical protein